MVRCEGGALLQGDKVRDREGLSLKEVNIHKGKMLLETTANRACQIPPIRTTAQQAKDLKLNNPKVYIIAVHQILLANNKLKTCLQV